MYTKRRFKKIRAIIPETVACVGTSANFDTTSIHRNAIATPLSTVLTFGANFSVTIEATTGNIYIYPESTAAEPGASNSFTLLEGNNIDINVENFLSLKGDSTTAAFQGIVWEF